MIDTCHYLPSALPSPSHRSLRERRGGSARRRKQPAASADPASPSTPSSSPRSLLLRAIRLPPPAKTLSGSERPEAQPGTRVLTERTGNASLLPWRRALATWKLHFPGSFAPESSSRARGRGAEHAGRCSPTAGSTLRASPQAPGLRQGDLVCALSPHPGPLHSCSFLRFRDRRAVQAARVVGPLKVQGSL